MLPGVVGNYRVLERISSGGTGVVYKAIDTRLNRPVAIKTFLESRTLGTETIANLQREARAVASIDHPYICKVYELLELEGQPLIVMEFLEGQTLAQRILEGVLPVAETVRYAREICEALSEAHAKRIVHRDIKPSNVMITVQKHVKVMDFGMAKILEEESQNEAEENTFSDEQLEFVGTLWYMSPEQILGGTIDARSDIFSTGVVIYQCLTGALPFDGNSRATYIRNVMVQSPNPMRRLSPDVPIELERIILKCLDKEPSHRYESASALATALSLLEADEISVRNFRTKDKNNAIRYSPKVKKVWLGIGIAGLVIVLAWSFGGWFRDRRDSREPKNLSALITWPSVESNSRISPDKQWISFISNRNGRKAVWIRNRSGSDPVPVETQQGTVVSQVWSPDGNQMACLIQQEDKTFLRIIPAFFGGPALASFEIASSSETYGLVRWIGRRIYVEKRSTLGWIDSQTGVWQSVLTESKLGFDFCRDFDVRMDEKAVLFSARSKGQEDLWLTDANGGNPTRLTDDAFKDRHPRWMSKGGRNLVFQSNRGGQIDLWQMRVSDRVPRQVTFSGAAEQPDDISLDGSLLTFQEIREDANLWCLNPRTQNRWQWTADALNDYWPSVSNTASLVAFQRNKPSLESGYEIYEGQILLSSWESNKLAASPNPVVEGYGAHLSPDGRFLASLRWIAGASRYSELWVRDLKTQNARQLTNRFPTLGSYLFPLDWTSTNTAWSPDSSDLFFVSVGAHGNSEIRKLQVSSGDANSVIVLSATQPTQSINDLRVAGDGKRLSYVLWTQDRSVWEVRGCTVTGDTEYLMLTVPRREKNWVFLRGWLKGDEAVLVLTSVRNADGTQQVEITRAGLDGKTERLGLAEHAFGATARLEPTSQILYLTLAENGIHNLYSFVLAQPAFTRLTDNQLPGVTFSGIEFTKDGTLLYTRTERNQDIWMIQFN